MFDSKQEDSMHIKTCLKLLPRILIVLISSIFHVLLSTPAAMAVSTELSEKSLEELMNIEVQKVTTASKFEQKVTEAPSSVSIVTADDIRQYGYRTLADVLKSVRGFSVTYDRNYAYLGVRGFGRPGDYNTRILLLVDGHPLNDAVYNTAAIGTEFVLDIDLIDRIEISRGPSSSLYGSSAFFGVINVITKNGQDVGGLELAAEASSYHARKGRITTGAAYTAGTQVIMSETAASSQGRDLYFPDYDDPTTNNGRAIKADADRWRSAFVKAASGDFALQGGYSLRDKTIPTAPYGTVFNTSKTFTTDEARYAELRYNHSINSRSDMSARLSYDEYRYAGDYLYDVSVAPDTPLMLVNKDDVIGRWLSGEVRSTLMTSAGKLIFGAACKNNINQNQLNYDSNPYFLRLADRSHSFEWAVFGQDEVHVTDSLIINAGIRYDHYETFGGTTNPRIGFLYYPGANSALKLLYGRAFRAPNAYELYYNDGSLYSKANPDLQPETITTYEAVYEHYLSSSVRSAISVYHYAIKDLITLQTDPADSLLVYNNIRSIRANGVELEFEGKSSNGMRGIASAAFQRTDDAQTHEVLTNSARILAKLNLSVPLASERIRAGIEEQYVSRRRTIGNNYVDGFYLTNITLMAQKVVQGLDLSFSVSNVFDKSYRDPASEEHVPLDSIAQDGRTYRVKVSALF